MAAGLPLDKLDPNSSEARLLRRMKYWGWVFGVLFCLNIAFSDALARDLFREMMRARDAQAVSATTVPDESSHRIGGRGLALMAMNFPVLVNLGIAIRGTPASLGPGYYACVVIGATYVPLILTTILFLAFNGPRDVGTLPGLEPPQRPTNHDRTT